MSPVSVAGPSALPGNTSPDLAPLDGSRTPRAIAASTVLPTSAGAPRPGASTVALSLRPMLDLRTAMSAPAGAPTAPAKAAGSTSQPPVPPAPPGSPDSPKSPGAGGSSSGGGFSLILLALLVSFGGLAALFFQRLTLAPAPWRPVAFVSLLERPG
jgi:hypothetical protein